MADDVETIQFVPSWYIMFTGPAERRFFVDRFTEKGFRHVNAFGFDAAADRWLVYDVTRVGTAVLALPPGSIDGFIAANRASGATILKYDLQSPPPQRSWLQTGMWCVTAIIHLTGIRSSAWRPRALWRDLKRAGAVEAFDDGRGMVATPSAVGEPNAAAV